MEIILFVTFLLISLALVCLGLFVNEHTELSLVGFLFLFLLAIILLFGTITQKVGTTTNTTCNYVAGNLTSTDDVTRNVYEPITWDNVSGTSYALDRLMGYWLAVISIVGFTGVLMSIKKSKGYK